MEKLVLTRVYDDTKQTLGVIVGPSYRAFTLELPWRNNERQKSCIPKGEYKVTPRTSEKYGKHFEVNNVPNRTKILIHTGNYHTDILGCILVGRGIRDINKDGLGDVTDSKAALNELLAKFPDGFELSII